MTMPVGRRKQPRQPRQAKPTREELGTGKIEQSPFARRAEHPGFKNPKQAARGGTRRSVLRGRIADAVDNQTIGRVERTDYTALGQAELLKKQGMEKRAAEAKAKAEKKAAAAAAKKAAAQEREDEVREQKRVNLAAKQAARKEAAAQARRDAAQARQDARDARNRQRQQERQERRNRGRG